jgi:hypothetical protein
MGVLVVEGPPVRLPGGVVATKGLLASGIIKLKDFIPLARISGAWRKDRGVGK